VQVGTSFPSPQVASSRDRERALAGVTKRELAAAVAAVSRRHGLFSSPGATGHGWAVAGEHGDRDRTGLPRASVSRDSNARAQGLCWNPGLHRHPTHGHGSMKKFIVCSRRLLHMLTSLACTCSRGALLYF